MSYSYEYPRPAVTVDIILIYNKTAPEILLIKRKNDPFKDKWAFPGGFLDIDEELKTAAIRELKEETSIEHTQIKQFKTYGTIHRDPRGRTVSVVYYAFINTKPEANAMDDAKDVKWFDLNQCPELAFDHDIILNDFRSFTSL